MSDNLPETVAQATTLRKLADIIIDEAGNRRKIKSRFPEIPELDGLPPSRRDAVIDEALSVWFRHQQSQLDARKGELVARVDAARNSENHLEGLLSGKTNNFRMEMESGRWLLEILGARGDDQGGIVIRAESGASVNIGGPAFRPEPPEDAEFEEVD